MNKRDFSVVGNEGTDNQELAKGIAFIKSRRAELNVVQMVENMRDQAMPNGVIINEAYGSILLKSVRCQLLYLMQRTLDANGVLWQSDNRKSFRSGQTSPGCEGLQIYTDCIRNSCT